jgi:hypothetical protein
MFGDSLMSSRLGTLPVATDLRCSRARSSFRYASNRSPAITNGAIQAHDTKAIQAARIPDFIRLHMGNPFLGGASFPGRHGIGSHCYQISHLHLIYQLESPISGFHGNPRSSYAFFFYVLFLRSFGH